MITQIGALILATSGVQFAAGFSGTFISLRTALENFEPTITGAVLSGYFAGFTVGAFFSGRIIERLGHIRAYAAFGGVVAAATAAMPLIVSPFSWLILRVVIGLGCAGLFVTTESWLNAKAEPSERGRIFSIYMVGTFIALALGQLLIGYVDIGSVAPFNIIVFLFALALVLVSTTRAEPPRIMAAPLPYGRLARTAPVAVAGAVLSGVIAGAFYALVPLWMQGRGIERATIGLVMLAAVLGGLAFQIPVGRLSDLFDRLVVLTLVGLGLVGATIALVFLPRTLVAILPAAVLFGGFLATLYPVCVAHAHDCMPAELVVAVSGRLVLLNGLGSVLGPVAGMAVIGRMGIDGVLYLMSASALLLAVIAGIKSLTSGSQAHLERPFEILTPQAAIVAHDSRSPRDMPNSC